MSDRFIPIPLPKLLATALKEIRQNQFLGIPGSLFFIPSDKDPFRMERYGRLMETPVGVAAGPHTQLAVNIIAAWLCGARYIELKTIQTLDELEVSKPCIDMQDEGYNCEWSQELKIEQSFNEYLNAWIIIHILRNELKFGKPLGTLFNMSAGYNMEGMLKDNVQWFLSRMMDCSNELLEAKNSIRSIYPEIDSLEIPPCISDHITLSTMHGCPPEEIEKIGLYLIKEKKLHTTIKLNPTLLGPEKLRFILNEKLGFETDVPDLAFEHDLKYPDAISMIKKLSAASDEEDLHFSVKLSNTLESRNHKSVFSEKESMMYMSGRALHPISITLAAKLQGDFDGKLDISFSAGADCYNLGKILASGMKPVTVCSDLLKPGGYGRLWQYFEQLRAEMSSIGASSIEEFILHSSDEENQDLQAAALCNLKRYADKVADEDSYKKRNFTDPSIKTDRHLGALDCIHAPCKDTCPTHQDIPTYLRQVANGDIDGAFETVYMTNPFPTVTGMICDHPCQLKCTRINYDSALHIRDVKRFIAENGKRPNQSAKSSIAGYKVAVIGAGPAGLSSAYYLRKAGIEVTVFEKKAMPGGMVSAAIPIFRLTDPAIAGDIDEILSSGVKLVDNYEINESRFEAIRNEYSAVFLSAGAQNAAGLRLDGIENAEAFNVLDFLYSVRNGGKNLNGKKVLIIGGGNTAMDAARTAFRMVGTEGKVTIVYRRTKKEMPADKGEIKAVLEEGIEILELTTPVKVIKKDSGNTALLCSKMYLP
ncbi:MAG: FAD-dependent oxidoreductase [Bacteroidales bacterium]|nr:FAD-dependent oxidoreductase [Bacteroidales bacterium]